MSPRHYQAREARYTLKLVNVLVNVETSGTLSLLPIAVLQYIEAYT